MTSDDPDLMYIFRMCRDAEMNLMIIAGHIATIGTHIKLWEMRHASE